MSITITITKLIIYYLTIKNLTIMDYLKNLELTQNVATIVDLTLLYGQELSRLNSSKDDDLNECYDIVSKYNFEVKKSKSWYGRISYTDKTIWLSESLLNHSKADVIDTIRHEFAHAVARKLYNERGHGTRWKRCCYILGCNPNRVSDTVKTFNVNHEPYAKIYFERLYGSTYALKLLNFTNDDSYLGKMSSSYISGKKSETLGKVTTVKSEWYEENKDKKFIIGFTPID